MSYLSSISTDLRLATCPRGARRDAPSAPLAGEPPASLLAAPCELPPPGGCRHPCPHRSSRTRPGARPPRRRRHRPLASVSGPASTAARARSPTARRAPPKVPRTPAGERRALARLRRLPAAMPSSCLRRPPPVPIDGPPPVSPTTRCRRLWTDLASVSALAALLDLKRGRPEAPVRKVQGRRQPRRLADGPRESALASLWPLVRSVAVGHAADALVELAAVVAEHTRCARAFVDARRYVHRRL